MAEFIYYLLEIIYLFYLYY